MVNRSLRDEPSGGPPELAIIDANEAALVLCREVRDRGQHGHASLGEAIDGACDERMICGGHRHCITARAELLQAVRHQLGA